MILTDTHTHLYSEQFDDDRSQVVKRALDQNISRFFIPAIDSTYYPGMFALQEQFPENIFLMAGLHPTHVKENFMEELDIVKKMLQQRKFYAIGEIGIDLYWDASFLQQQQDAFKMQISWAKENNLPIAIHCRDAFDEIFEILEDEKAESLFGIFHCFTGNLEQAKQAISCGMKLGIGGVVTFKNGKIDQFLNEIPLSNIVLETDAPYLAPAPYRGKRNESSYLVKVVDKLVDIYGLRPDEIAKVTTQNSIDIFGV
ncbi:MAG: TatD family hydrolase [Flavobacteriaceae bacterium]|nr:TatD family hydrolase [Flavobacteriaceae bacterium]